jgi:hypothetical protein
MGLMPGINLNPSYSHSPHTSGTSIGPPSINTPSSFDNSNFLSRLNVIDNLMPIPKNFTISENDLFNRFIEIAIFNLYYTDLRDTVTNIDFVEGPIIFYKYNDPLINEDTMTLKDIERINKNIQKLTNTNEGENFFHQTVREFLNTILFRNEFKFVQQNKPLLNNLNIQKLSAVIKINDKIQIDANIDLNDTEFLFKLMLALFNNKCEYLNLPVTRNFMKKVILKSGLSNNEILKLKTIADFLKAGCDTIGSNTDKKKWIIPDGSFSPLIKTIQENGLDNDNLINVNEIKKKRQKALYGSVSGLVTFGKKTRSWFGSNGKGGKRTKKLKKLKTRKLKTRRRKLRNR